MGLRYFVFLVLLGLTLSTLLIEAKSLKGHKKSHHDESKKLNDPEEEAAAEEAPKEEAAEEKPAEEGAEEKPAEEAAAAEEEGAASGGAEGASGEEESGSGEEAPPPTEAATLHCPKPCQPDCKPSCAQVLYKVVGPLGGHPHPGPPAALNPCPQPRYCDPAKCKDPIGCAPSCSDTCCADVLIPIPQGSGGGPCNPACAPTYQPDCCMGGAPPMAPQPVFPPMGPQPGYAPPAGSMMPEPYFQAPPVSCDQGCYASNCAPPCPPQCCHKKKSYIHHRKSRSITSHFAAMCH